MSDERRDDEAVGQALGRAVGSQTVRETPYAASRLAHRIDRPAGRGWTYALPMAAALALFVAMGAFFATRGPQGGVATPNASVAPSASGTAPAATAPAAGTATPSQATPRPVLVYFGRDGLPPVAGVVSAAGGPSTGRPEDSIGTRLSALFNARASEVPPGAINAAALPSGGTTSISVNRIDGDLATVEIGITGGWPARGATQSQALLQQLVYTITEEPGIRRAMIKDQGKQTATIDQLVIDKPLSREDVFGYASVGSRDPVRGFGDRAGTKRTVTTSYSVDTVAPGLARFEIAFDPRRLPNELHPDWDVSVTANPETFDPAGGKWKLTIQLYNVTDAKGVGEETVGRTPLRSIKTNYGVGGTPLVYVLALDDLRPWRTALTPTGLVIDIGGHPQSISGRNAVHSPQPNETVGRTIQLTGVASAFEANVQFRVRDAQGRIVASGFTTATNCCEPGGTFTGSIQVPASVPAGRITLEVFQGSPRDGSDLAVIAVPLTLR